MIDAQERITLTDNLTVKFDGDNAISIHQLIGCITGINTAYQACLNSEYISPSMDLQVVAVNQGSVEIVLQSVIALAPDLVTHIPQVVTTFKTLLEIIKLKQALGGKEPKSVETEGKVSKVTNHEGSITYHDCHVTNIYLNNPTVDAGLSNAFSSLCVATPREAVQLTSGQESLRINRERYSDMAADIVSKINTDSVQANTIEVKLRIRKPDFIGNTMWSFVDENGNSIAASIEDKRFSKRVKAGAIELSANDLLTVRLRIEIVLDKYMNVISKKHYVEEVLGFTTPTKTQQTTIDLDRL